MQKQYWGWAIRLPGKERRFVLISIRLGVMISDSPLLTTDQSVVDATLERYPECELFYVDYRLEKADKNSR